MQSPDEEQASRSCQAGLSGAVWALTNIVFGTSQQISKYFSEGSYCFMPSKIDSSLPPIIVVELLSKQFGTHVTLQEMDRPPVTILWIAMRFWGRPNKMRYK